MQQQFQQAQPGAGDASDWQPGFVPRHASEAMQFEQLQGVLQYVRALSRALVVAFLVQPNMLLSSSVHTRVLSTKRSWADVSRQLCMLLLSSAHIDGSSGADGSGGASAALAEHRAALLASEVRSEHEHSC
jgi:hypothetical protein